jgi:nitroreductase
MEMDFKDVVNARSSVRSYSNRDVEPAKIERVLEFARLAPSWANKQCWGFVVVTEPGKIEALAKAAGPTNRWVSKVPVIIAACGDPAESGTRDGIEYFAVDVAIAMEHLILAATELGLGTCWIGYFKEAKVKEILEIPENMRVVALSPVGYPAGKAGIQERITKLVLKSKNRKAFDEIVHYETW